MEEKVELTEEGRKARNEYYRNYRKKHPEKMREIRIRHLNKMGRMLAQAAADNDPAENNEGD